MLKIKKRLLSFLIASGLVAASVLPAAFEPVFADNTYDDLYIEALDTEPGASFYKTETVRKGTFSVYYTTMPRSDYDDYSYLYNPIIVGNVKFVRYLAKNGDWIEVGDPVCDIEVTVDESRIAELEENIAKEEEQLGTYAYTCEKLLEEYDEMYKSGSGDAELAKLLYDRLKGSYDKELKSRREVIDEMQSEYDGLRMAQTMTQITATSTGFVAHLESLHHGMELSPYYFLGVIYRVENAKLYLEGGSDYLRFGLKSTLVQTDGGNTIEADGMVVSTLDPSIPPALIGEKTVLEFSDEYKNFNPRKDVVLKVERIHMENALMVRNKAVYNDSHGDYVLINDNGRKTRRYVIVGGSNNDDTWIISGVNEGDEVIVK